MKQRLNSQGQVKRTLMIAVILMMMISGSTITVHDAPTFNSATDIRSKILTKQFKYPSLDFVDDLPNIAKETEPTEEAKEEVKTNQEPIDSSDENQSENQPIATQPVVTQAIEENDPLPKENDPIENEEIEQTEQVEQVEQVYPLLSEIDKSSPTEDRILALFGFFLSEGLTPEASAGIIGNIAIESCFDPTAVSGDGYYHGLCQWNTTDGGMHWWDGNGGILDWLNANGYSWDSFEGQAKAILYCDRKGYLTGENLEKFMAMVSVEEATDFFRRKYEGGAGKENRIWEAQFAYELYQNPEGEYTGNKPYTVR